MRASDIPADRVLIAVEHRHGRAGIYRDEEDERLVLTTDLRSGGTGLQDSTPIQAGIKDLTIVGGVLPAGAVRAEVRNELGEMQAAVTENGVWLTVLEAELQGDEHPVLYRDAGGEIALRPHPGEVTRERLDGATEPCPACSAREWDLVTSHNEDEDLFEDDEEFEELVCRRCGHREYLGGVVSEAEDEPPDEMVSYAFVRATGDAALDDLEKQEALLEAELARDAEENLRAASFPIYCLAGDWATRESGSSFGSIDGEIRSVTLYHEQAEDGAWIKVTSSLQDEEDPCSLDAVLRECLEEALDDEDQWHEDVDEELDRRAEALFSLSMITRARALRERVARLRPSSVTLRVNEEPVAFQSREEGPTWAALAKLGEVVVVVAADGVDAASIEIVTRGSESVSD